MEKGDDHFIAGYHDPLSIKPGVTYWGVFEPVTYTIHEVLADTNKTLDSGWVVLVQSPAIQ